jgi:pimeloyl-ACP methyl ester carboxylesterase
METFVTGSVLTNDGVRIHYVEAGEGEPVVLLPGFAQSALEFDKQIADLSRDYRVIAMDHRGHGRSDKPEYGYRVSRLAADLRELLLSLDLHDVVLLGHSLGCSVIWSYWDLFGGDRIRRLILVDQPAVVAADLVTPPERPAQLGAVFTTEMAAGVVAGLRGADAAATAEAIVAMMHTPAMADDDIAWIVEQNRLLPGRHAAMLHLDNHGNDWRDVLPRIDKPTLVIGGAQSVFGAEVAPWLASRIPGAAVRVFSAAEDGSHLMFRENARLFNAVVRSFLRMP